MIKLKNLLKEYTDYYSRTIEKHDEKVFKENLKVDNLKKSRGIEVGHIFYFGQKYSNH